MPVACLRVGHKVIDLPDCLEPEAPVQKACVLSLCFGLLNTRHAGIGRIEADGKKILHMHERGVTYLRR